MFASAPLLFGNAQQNFQQPTHQQHFIYQQQQHLPHQPHQQQQQQQQNFVNSYEALNKAALLTQWQQNQ